MLALVSDWRGSAERAGNEKRRTLRKSMEFMLINRFDLKIKRFRNHEQLADSIYLMPQKVQQHFHSRRSASLHPGVKKIVRIN